MRAADGRTLVEIDARDAAGRRSPDLRRPRSCTHPTDRARRSDRWRCARTRPAISAAPPTRLAGQWDVVDRTVARWRAACSARAIASCCAEGRTPWPRRSIFRCSCSDARRHRAYGPRGRGHRLRRLHPQDRRRPEAAPGIVEARLNFTNRRLAVDWREDELDAADVIAALRRYRLSRASVRSRSAPRPRRRARPAG